MLAKNEANDICWLSGLTVSVKSWLTMEMIATELSLWFTLTLSLSSLIIVLPNLKKNSQPEVILHSFKDLLEGYKFWPNPLRISEKAMASHSSTLAWKIPWTEEPGRLQSMGMDWATSLSLFTFHFHALDKEMATHSSVLVWRIPGTGSLVGCHLWGRTKSDTSERLHFHFHLQYHTLIISIHLALKSGLWSVEV